MKIRKLLPKRRQCRPKTPSKYYNPFAGYVSADPSSDHERRCPSPNPSFAFPSSPAGSSSSSTFPSASASPLSARAEACSSPRSLFLPSRPEISTKIITSPLSVTSSRAPPKRLPSRARSRSAIRSPPSVFPFRAASPRPQIPKRTLLDPLFELENEKLIETFRIIDTDGDGKISEQELAAMWRRFGKKVSGTELRLMIQEADTNGDGVLDLQEFVTFFKNMVVHKEMVDPVQHADEIRLAFDLTDFTRDGLVSAAELQILMNKVRKKRVSAADCAAMIRCVDSDGDGLINFTEFQRLMTSSVFAQKN